MELQSIRLYRSFKIKTLQLAKIYFITEFIIVPPHAQLSKYIISLLLHLLVFKFHDQIHR